MSEPLRTHHLAEGDQRRPRVIELLEQVGLGAQHLDGPCHDDDQPVTSIYRLGYHPGEVRGRIGVRLAGLRAAGHGGPAE